MLHVGMAGTALVWIVGMLLPVLAAALVMALARVQRLYGDADADGDRADCAEIDPVAGVRNPADV